METSIEMFMNNYFEINDYLIKQGEPTYAMEVSNHFRKALLLYSASYLECKIKDLLLSAAKKCIINEPLCMFFQNKAIERQYHTYFKWDGNNVNSFLGLFGETFKNVVKKDIDQDHKLSASIRSFLTIGNERNLMAHENSYFYNLSMTITDIYDNYKNALYFIDYLYKRLSNM